MLGPFATASRRTPIHQVSLLSHAACASMSTTTPTTTTTTTTTRDRGPLWPHWMGPKTRQWCESCVLNVVTVEMCSATWQTSVLPRTTTLHWTVTHKLSSRSMTSCSWTSVTHHVIMTQQLMITSHWIPTHRDNCLTMTSYDPQSDHNHIGYTPTLYAGYLCWMGRNNVPNSNDHSSKAKTWY